MEIAGIVESVAGFALFAVAVLLARPLWRLYQRQPQPVLLRGEVMSELILLGYFVLLLLSFVVGVHGFF